MRTQIINTESSNEIISIEEAMEMSRITDNYDETVVTFCLDAAHDLVEKWLNRKLVKTTVIGVQREYKSEILLPYPPIHKICSITAENSNDDEIVIKSSDYKFDTVTQSVRFKSNTNYTNHKNFRIMFECGYLENQVPSAVKHAIRQLFATFYENREDYVIGTQINEVPLTARRILKPYRVRSI